MNQKDIKEDIKNSLAEIAKHVRIIEKRTITVPADNISRFGDSEYINVPKDRTAKFDEYSSQESELSIAFREAKRKADELEKKLKKVKNKKIVYALSGEEGEGTEEEVKDILEAYNEESKREKTLFIRTEKFETKIDKTKAYPKYSEVVIELVEILKELAVRKGKQIQTLVQLLRLIEVKTGYGRTIRNVSNINESWIGDAFNYIKEKIVMFFKRIIFETQKTNDKWENMLDAIETEFQREFRNV